jgi:hypothetical protein
MIERAIPYDYAVHSDFLIHWTGKDIDKYHHPEWWNINHDHSSKTGTVATDLYLQRLKDILTFGLWMTCENDNDPPNTPMCCFTELKLSDSRRHARQYGRLGIGVKRPFVFDRFGRPLAYFGFGPESHNDRFLEACRTHLPDKSLLNFFKPMNSARPLTYDLYSESEWRIVFFKELLEQRKIIDPRDPANKCEHKYFNSLSSDQQHKLNYLVPLDGWFSMIIYPSRSVKKIAQWDENSGIIEQITRLKTQNDHANAIEKGDWPIEVEIDACRHF